MNDKQKALIELTEEQRLQLLFDAVTDYAIYMLDPEGVVVTWNLGAQRMKGYTAAEIIGQSFSKFFTEKDLRAQQPQKALQVAAAEGRYEAEGQRIRKDGSIFWAFAIIDAVFSPDGTLLGFAKITRDITKKRADAAELQAAKVQLLHSQKMEAVGQLTGGIAHDFNNLLTVVLGNLDRIQRRLDNLKPTELATEFAKDLARPLSMAMEGGRKAAQLTHRLLAFSRRQALEPRPVNANHLVGGMMEIVRHTIGETIEVCFKPSTGIWPVFVDANQLENALLNLVVNSRDAMPAGGKLTISTENVTIDSDLMSNSSEFTAGQYIVVAVTDSGNGIPADDLGRIFEPFFTTKETGKGSGLGLAMVHGFVKQSGGHVRVRSFPGEGTTIELYLPRDLLQRERVKKVVSDKPKPERVPLGQHRGTVLVVEDNEGVRVHARSSLEDLGFDVVEAADGPSAMRIIKKMKSIDLLFTDVVLPGGMTGRDVAEGVLKLQPQTPVLFTSGYTDDAIGRDFGLDESTFFLRKPYTQEDLAKKIDELLDSNQHRTEAS